MKQHLYIINLHTKQPLQSLIHYLNSQFPKYDKLTIISSIFQIANTKPQISASRNPIKGYRMENKTKNLHYKLFITRSSFIYLSTNFEAETLVLSV